VTDLGYVLLFLTKFLPSRFSNSFFPDIRCDYGLRLASAILLRSVECYPVKISWSCVHLRSVEAASHTFVFEFCKDIALKGWMENDEEGTDFSNYGVLVKLYTMINYFGSKIGNVSVPDPPSYYNEYSFEFLLGYQALRIITYYSTLPPGSNNNCEGGSNNNCGEGSTLAALPVS
ncbi:hypothetical protein C5167_022972, partial [Papaver somniferum]